MFRSFLILSLVFLFTPYAFSMPRHVKKNGLSTPPEQLLTPKDVVAGSGFSCVLTQGGEVYCWGINNNGQLGAGIRDFISTRNPVRVLGLENQEIVKLDSGGSHSCAVSKNKNLFCWGRNSEGQIGNGDTTSYSGGVFEAERIKLPRGKRAIHQIALGSDHTLAITEKGQLYAWGENLFGKLGFSHERDESKPTLVTDLASKKFVAASAGDKNSCAITDLGKLYCWGRNAFGQTGTHSSEDQVLPLPVVGLESQKIIQVALGENHACALTDIGRAYCWGENFEGQLGLGLNSEVSHTNQPTLVAALEKHKVRQISARSSYTCANTEEGQLFCWGRSVYPILGKKGLTSNGPILIQFPLGEKVQSFDTGLSHLIAFTESGNVYCSGDRERCSLGSANFTEDLSSPELVPFAESIINHPSLEAERGFWPISSFYDDDDDFIPFVGL